MVDDMNDDDVWNPVDSKIKEYENLSTCWSSIKTQHRRSFDSDSFVSCHVSEKLSTKLFLGLTNVVNIPAHGLVIPFNQLRKNTSQWTCQLQVAAGENFIKEIMNISTMKSDEIRLCNGYDLKARFIILTGDPNYNDKYPDAAEYALHSSIRTALQTACEQTLKTVAMVPLHNDTFPQLTAIHTTLKMYLRRKSYSHDDSRKDIYESLNGFLKRITIFPFILLKKWIFVCFGTATNGTLRKCMEQLSDKLDSVTLILGHSPTLKDSYLDILPLYFPRTSIEIVKSREFLGGINCNTWGELIHKERAIRISTLEDEINVNENNSKERLDDANEDVILPKHESLFSEMSGDHDKKQRRRIVRSNSSRETNSQIRIYQRLLRHARTSDLSSLASYKALYVNGRDVGGNKVIVIVGRNIPFCAVHPEKIMLYVIKCLDEFANGPFTVVYFHTMATEVNHPTIDFIKKLYNTLDERYKRNLVRFCVVHSTVWMKINAWIFTTFSAGAIRKKITSVPNVPALYNIVPPDQISIPSFVLDYDMKEHPGVYQKAQSGIIQQSRMSLSQNDVPL